MKKYIIVAIPIVVLIAGAVWFHFGLPGWPTPKTGVVAVISHPASVEAGESFVISWQVNPSEPVMIPHTAIHYGPESRADIGYPGLTPEFNLGNFKTPDVFTSVITAPQNPGKLYFRAHAIIEDREVWTEELIIDVGPGSAQDPVPSEIISKEPIEDEAPPPPPPTPTPEIPTKEEPPPPPQPEPEPTPPPPTPQPTVQEFNLEQSVYPGFFSPDPLIVKKGIPLKINATTLHREHINRLSIQPWISSSDLLIPGKVVVIEFTPDQIGEFKIRNVGHGFEGILKVVE